MIQSDQNVLERHAQSRVTFAIPKDGDRIDFFRLG
jgi:hypothetical protein